MTDRTRTITEARKALRSAQDGLVVVAAALRRLVPAGPPYSPPSAREDPSPSDAAQKLRLACVTLDSVRLRLGRRVDGQPSSRS